MMTRRERLMATLQGKPVDRPAVSFYEVGGWKMDRDSDEFTVWNDPSWRPLVRLAHAKTDLIRMVGAEWRGGTDNGLGQLITRESRREGDTRFTRTTIRAPGRALTAHTSQSKNVQTIWTLEHFLKTTEDIEAYLKLPEPALGTVDVSGILAEEKTLGDAGIVSIELSDPLCGAASLFSMEDYTVAAMTEPELFHRLLQRCARILFPQCEQIARACPGRLWRICGSEYGSAPFLPPHLYDEYVVGYTGHMVQTIRQYGGYARIHSHGRLRGIMPLIAKMKPDGLDPLEPPPQGDMELTEIKALIGHDTVLMGNIEAADIENLPEPVFAKKIAKALREGTAGEGRGFILHPSACPYGREITARTMANYETMVRLAENWQG